MALLKSSADRQDSAPRLPVAPIQLRVIRQRRLYEEIVDQIQELVRAEGLRPGDRLPAERDLAIRLGVSRPVVREAMIALETVGAIEVLVGDGTYIREPRTAMEASLGWVPRLDGAGPGAWEQFQARKLIEPMLANLAASRVTDDEIAFLSAAVERCAAQFARGELAEEDDRLFHTKLAEFSGNLILAGLVRHLWELRDSEAWRILRGRLVKPRHRALVVRDRRAIVEALRRRDGPGAQKAMQRMLNLAQRRLFD